MYKRQELRSSIREFLGSEAMHHLGIPATRALSLVGTGETVVRDMFYDGHPVAEPGAVVCRVAPSFTRFGHFELLAARGEYALLQRLVDFTIARDFPELVSSSEQRLGAWFTEICERTARLMVHWMRVGFVHGVIDVYKRQRHRHKSGRAAAAPPSAGASPRDRFPRGQFPAALF